MLSTLLASKRFKYFALFAVQSGKGPLVADHLGHGRFALKTQLATEFAADGETGVRGALTWAS
jgi:hypothetical protein